MPLCQAEDYILYIFRYVSAFLRRDLLLILTKDFVSFFQVSRLEIDKIKCSKYTRFQT